LLLWPGWQEISIVIINIVIIILFAQQYNSMHIYVCTAHDYFTFTLHYIYINTI